MARRRRGSNASIPFDTLAEGLQIVLAMATSRCRNFARRRDPGRRRISPPGGASARTERQSLPFERFPWSPGLIPRRCGRHEEARPLFERALPMPRRSMDATAAVPAARLHSRARCAIRNPLALRPNARARSGFTHVCASDPRPSCDDRARARCSTRGRRGEVRLLLDAATPLNA